MNALRSMIGLISTTTRKFHNALNNARNFEAINEQLEVDNSDGFIGRKIEEEWLCNKYVNRVKSMILEDDEAMIGIYGTGGVGKTTLGKHIHNWVMNNVISCSDHVNVAIAWVSVGFGVTIYQLQQKVANAFELDLQDEDVNRRAAIIYAFLCSLGKYILFLDDLWGDFRLEDVGIIPRQCKLILMSRSLDICRLFGCQKVIKLESLSPEESWELFHHHIGVGGYGVLDSQQLCYVKKVLYQVCGGLPLAITLLAKSNASIEWNVKEMDTFCISSRVTQLQEVIDRLKLSYDRLINNVKLQNCFLYAAIYIKGNPICKEELIHLWIKKEVIDDIESLEAQLDMGHTILNKLINSCLMETCKDGSSIKMHHLSRQMALSIAKDSNLIPKLGALSKLESNGNLHRSM
ncbi:disease resistance protein RPS5-like [Amaranthus tricolor]|uniref:disease resistance protein RPS5-like n=1 Tax=Amaranthus tricolor TaxID=29722 RepID=UPI00258BC252|nr:disease resistance protein RPS5-like [Amaranthus tricolor]